MTKQPPKNYNIMLPEDYKIPEPVGEVRQGRIVRFTRCAALSKGNIRYPLVKPVPWDADVRWHEAVYMWADVENGYGLHRNIGLLVPVKVIDSVLDSMHLPRMSASRKWQKMHYDGLCFINGAMLIQALNRHCCDVTWLCDDVNGRLVYNLKIT